MQLDEQRLLIHATLSQRHDISNIKGRAVNAGEHPYWVHVKTVAATVNALAVRHCTTQVHADPPGNKDWTMHRANMAL
jgi:hypothetical protein